VFAPPTNGNTWKFSGARAGPTAAAAEPRGPAEEPLGHAVGPVATRSSKLQRLKPLADIFMVAGQASLICSTVVVGRFTAIAKVSLDALGFCFVPAFAGESLAFRVTASVWATAPPASPSAAATAAAPINNVRKRSPPPGGGQS